MDRIKDEFLTGIQSYMDVRCKEVSTDLELHLEEHLPELIDSFHDCTGLLLKEFFDAEKRGVHGALAWIYLSYLRSGVLNHTECIRVDCYDEKDRISDIETAKNWDFAYVWESFYGICVELEHEFGDQTRVRVYELDLLVYELAEHFYNLTKSFLGAIVQKWLEKYGMPLMAGQKVNFMMGEFMDRAEFVLRWDRDHIEWISEEDRDNAWDEID